MQLTWIEFRGWTQCSECAHCSSTKQGDSGWLLTVDGRCASDSKGESIVLCGPCLINAETRARHERMEAAAQAR